MSNEVETVTITLPRFVEVFIEKADKSYTIDLSTTSPQVNEFFVRNGIVQKYGDSASSVSLSANVDGRRIPLVGADLAKARMEAVKVIDECHARLMSGDLRKTRESGVDPVESEARKMAIAIARKKPDFVAYLKANGLKPTDKAAVEKLAAIAAPIAADPKTVKIAKRRVAELAELSVE